MVRKAIKGVMMINKLAYINTLMCIAGMIFVHNPFSYEIDISARFFFAVLSFISGNWIGNHIAEIKEYKAGLAQKVFFCVLCFYSAFALVGNACFVYPLTMRVSLYHLAQYTVTCIWVVPIITFICCIMISYKNNEVTNTHVSLWVIGICIFIFGMVTAIYLIAYNPCIGTYDTAYAMELAVTTGAKGMEDITPPFYVIWLEIILKFWKSPYAVVVVQLSWFAFVLCRALSLLCKKGLTDKGVLVSILFVALSVNIMVFLITIWKDIPYTISIFWLTVILAYFQSGYSKWYLYVELSIALVGTYFFRQNGIIPFILSCIAISLIIRKYKIWITVIASIFFVFFIKYPVYNSLEIDRNQGGVPYVGMGLDIVGVYYNEGELSDDAMDFVAAMIPDLETYEYTPYTLNAISADIDISTLEFLKIYIDTLVKNPQIVIRGALCRSDGIWNIFQGTNGHFLGATITGASESADLNWSLYFPNRKENIMTEKMNNIVCYAIWKDLSGMFMGRVGVWTLIMFICVFVLICKKQYIQLLATVPCAGQILSLVVASGWANYRYMVPIEFMSIFICGLTLLTENKNNRERK